MVGWGRNGRYFFPLARDWEKHPLYQRQPDRDLALLLMRDAHETDSAEVRFSYPVFIERTAWWEGNDHRRHGRDAIRNALIRMAEHGFCTLPEPARRRGQGRQQGWFVVTICNYKTYRLGSGDGQQGGQQGRQQADNERATASREVEVELGRENECRRSAGPSADALAVSEYLRDAILSHTPDHICGKNGACRKWARDIDLAIRVDGREPGKLKAAIDYAHRRDDEPFWRANIQSGKKLRQQYETIKAQYRRDRALEERRA